MNTAAANFWQEFLAGHTHVSTDTPYQTWYFGDTAEMAAELANLVVAGIKTATASLAETNKLVPEIAPAIDGYSVVTDFDGVPVCVIQTTEIKLMPFKNVDARFAFDEGEGDRSLDYWRQVHKAYFEREAAGHSFVFDENSIICCERFHLLFPK